MLLPLFSVRLKARKTPTQAPILDPDKMLAAVLIRSSERESSGKPDLTLPLTTSASFLSSLSPELKSPQLQRHHGFGTSYWPQRVIQLVSDSRDHSRASSSVYSGATASSSPFIPGAATRSARSSSRAVFRPLPPYQQQPWRLPPLPLLFHFLNGIKLHILQGLFYDIKYT